MLHAIGTTHRDAVLVNRGHSRPVGVDQPALVVIGGPADRVASIDPERLALEQLQGLAISMEADPGREQSLGTPTLVGEGDLPLAYINAGHGVTPARQSLPCLPRSDLEHHAGLVRPDMTKFLAGSVDPREHGQLAAIRPDLAVGGQPGLDRSVDLGAQPPPRGINRGGLAFAW